MKTFDHPRIFLCVFVFTGMRDRAAAKKRGNIRVISLFTPSHRLSTIGMPDPCPLPFLPPPPVMLEASLRYAAIGGGLAHIQRHVMRLNECVSSFTNLLDFVAPDAFTQRFLRNDMGGVFSCSHGLHGDKMKGIMTQRTTLRLCALAPLC